MKASIILAIVASFAFSTTAFAAPKQEGKVHGPCHQILKACQDAGFVKGMYKEGYGLWRDCIDPIMQGKTTVSGAAKALPSVDTGLVAACKAKNPKFGSGEVGSE
ncbi:MAG TPA: hypothetical protein VEM40_08670 [Nitrospirota bacterium]|nr:hypothetical protein [Nitrospirota bacterium]